MRAIDFGTSSTAAAQRIDGGDAELVTFRGNYAFPSCVAMHEGDLVCGEEAEGILPGDPAAGTRVPKLILADNGTAHLDGHPVPVEEIIAPILREADGGDAPSVPGPRILTHPASWEPTSKHCQVLLDAALRAGLDDVALISEPEGVAWHLAERLEAGTTFGVFDLGGGTCDIAALERVPDGFELLARPRAETIGGELANSLLTELVLERLGDQDDEAVDALRAAQRLRDGARATSIDTEALVWLQCLIGVERQVRFAKTRSSPRVRLPPPLRGMVEVTQAELSDRMRPHLERAADALADVLREAGLEPSATPVMLSGAASVMPDVAQTLHDRCGVTVTPIRPAKGAVALGALAALEARRTPLRPPVGPARPSAPVTEGRRPPVESSPQSQENVTRLVRDPEWEETPAPVRARLLDTVLKAPVDEEIAFFTADAEVVARLPSQGTPTPAPDPGAIRVVDKRHGSKDPAAPTEKVRVALLITSARVCWAGVSSGGPLIRGQVLLSEVREVVPKSTAKDGFCGFRLHAGELRVGFTIVSLDETELLERITYIAERMPSGAPSDGGALLANLRKLIDSGSYVPGSKSAAWLAHMVVTATPPEEIELVEDCNVKSVLVTTSERLLWTHEGSSFITKATPIAEIESMAPKSSESKGLYGFRVTARGSTHDFVLPGASVNMAYIWERRKQPPIKWLGNMDKLREFPGWYDLHLDAMRSLQHAVVGWDEELLGFAHCQYQSFTSWGRLDGSKTTGLLLTTERVVWARVGSFSGLSSGAVLVKGIGKVEGGNDRLFVTIDGTKHGFWWKPAGGMVQQLRELHSKARGR